MPFTAAHPAIVLPFLKTDKRILSATGLVAGSIVPDFEYFLNMSVKGQHSHTIAGLFYFDLPMAILIALLFHLIVKKNLIDNLPTFFQRRLRLLREFNFLQYLKQYPWALALAILMGASSHLLWDSFTHRNGYFVNHLSVYKGVFPFQGVKYPMFYAMQHISTMVGLIAVGVYLGLMKPDPAVIVSRPAVVYWMVILLISSAIVSARFVGDLTSLSLGNFVVSSITALFCSLLVTGKIRFNQAIP